MDVFLLGCAVTLLCDRIPVFPGVEKKNGDVYNEKYKVVAYSLVADKIVMVREFPEMQYSEFLTSKGTIELCEWNQTVPVSRVYCK